MKTRIKVIIKKQHINNKSLGNIYYFLPCARHHVTLFLVIRNPNICNTITYGAEARTIFFQICQSTVIINITVLDYT